MNDKIGSSLPVQLHFKFTFGPLLQKQGAELWSPEEMEHFAELYDQAVHQLRVVARILRHRRARAQAPRPPARLTWIPPRRAALN